MAVLLAFVMSARRPLRTLRRAVSFDFMAVLRSVRSLRRRGGMDGVVEEVLLGRIERRQVEGTRARNRHCWGILDAILRIGNSVRLGWLC